MASIAYGVPTTSIQGDDSEQHSSKGFEALNDSYRNYSTAGDTPSRRSSTSPGNKSRSFSISDILSDDVGSRKRPSNGLQESRVKQAKLDYRIASPEGANGKLAFSSQAAVTATPTLLSPIAMYSGLHQQLKGPGDWTTSTDTLGGIHNQVYPVSYPSSVHMMSSPTTLPAPVSFPTFPTAVSPPMAAATVSFPSYQPLSSPYSNPHFAAQMNYLMKQQQFQMMAVAASQQQQQIQQHHGGGIMSAVPLGPHEGRSRSVEQDSNGKDNSENNSFDENTLHHQLSTPLLLKNKWKTSRTADTTNTVHTSGGSGGTPTTSTPEGQQNHPGYYPKAHYSRSPLKPPNTTFSPSIFLTRPSTSTVSRTPTDASSSPEVTDNEREVGPVNAFMTSTPIRRGEKTTFVSLHSSHSPISSGHSNRQGLDHHYTSEYHSGSDSEVPLLRRPRVPRKRSKQHLVPSYNSLPENTNSMPPPNSSTRHTPSHAPPSSLLTSYTAQPLGGGMTSGGGIQHNYSVNDSGFASDTSIHKPPPPSFQQPSQQQQENLLNSYSTKSFLMNVSTENIYKTPVKNAYKQANNNMKYPDAWGSSPFTDNLRKTGRIQSVPPWFVCSDKRRHGKRLRLTEAINKSLMETPSQTVHQLPAEWKKFAYGQTDDQKDLTQKARSFLKCRPRVLQFEKNV